MFKNILHQFHIFPSRISIWNRNRTSPGLNALDRSLPLMNELGKTIAQMYKTTFPKSPIGIALTYAVNRWDNLLNYLSDGSLEIDNNCKKNNVNPYQWLKKVLELIPEYPANKIGDLLPQNIKL